MKSLDELIKKVIKDMHSNLSVSDIAAKHSVSEELVSEILQIYTTHQGIDIQGIIDRLPEM